MHNTKHTNSQHSNCHQASCHNSGPPLSSCWLPLTPKKKEKKKTPSKSTVRVNKTTGAGCMHECWAGHFWVLKVMLIHFEWLSPDCIIHIYTALCFCCCRIVWLLCFVLMCFLFSLYHEPIWYISRKNLFVEKECSETLMYRREMTSAALKKKKERKKKHASWNRYQIKVLLQNSLFPVSRICWQSSTGRFTFNLSFYTLNETGFLKLWSSRMLVCTKITTPRPVHASQHKYHSTSHWWMYQVLLCVLLCQITIVVPNSYHIHQSRNTEGFWLGLRLGLAPD